ncbi:polar amino acid ABC transporter [Aeromonas bestiarum]|uniref:substrate-binding periplasmic protein n=1 Tax=Aeromonas bestiarum TaxID=105751 RepID=UPI000CD42D3A|nr:transporter substrate-binding domain-containing protein [Aeromonas bestiarum]POG21546.1 polar amino acid ABC transporter [Aeromonas bestiarum]
MGFLYRILLHAVCLTATLVAPLLAAAEPLRVGVSFAIPPYVIEEEGRGIELDLLREAFRNSGYEPSFEYLPLERTFRMLESGKLDAIINAKPGMLGDVFLSQPVIAFHNRVFTLSKTHISTLDDMKTLRVSAFQRARQVLGGAFASMADQNPRYEEVAKQQGQVHRLMLGRVDAVVLEQRVFYYYLAQLANSKYGAELYAPGRVRQYDLFAPTQYHFAFRQAVQQRWFDRQLNAMRADGRYQKIFETYGATP